MADSECRRFPYYMEGDYSQNWRGLTIPADYECCGQILIIRNTHGNGNTRLYAYSEGTWGYTEMSGD